MKVNLVYVPQMKEVAEFFRESEFYNNEKIMPLEYFESLETNAKTLIIGRNGRYHHHDLDHIKLAKQKKLVPSYDLTSLVLFDRHTDYNFDRTPIKQRKKDYLHEGCWVSRGILLNLYSNIMMIGVDAPSAGSPMELLKGDFISPTKVMKWLDEVEIFPNNPGIVNDKYYPEFESLLKTNPSVLGYKIVEGEYINIQFKTIEDVDYSSTKEKIIVSTDLDILDESEMLVDYWQGGLTTKKFISLTQGLPRKIGLSIISGYTEDKSNRTNHSLTNMSKILAAHSSALSQSI